MWVMLAMFWANTEGNDVERYLVYKAKTFNTYEQCQKVLLNNRDDIILELSNMDNNSNQFSIKCIDAYKYPQVFTLFNKKQM
jgi:hypothetical protein